MKNILSIMGLLIFVLGFSACKQKSTSGTAETAQPTQNLLQKPENISISNPSNDADCVYLTSDQNGLPYLSWIERDSTGHKYFYFSKFDEVQEKFGGKISIPIEQNAAIHEEGMPKLAVKGNGDLFALYETSIPVEGSKWGLGDVRYVLSSDGGNTWSTPQSLDPEDLAQGKSGNFTNMSRLNNGEIGIAWLGTDFSSENGGRPIKFTQTTADGSVLKSQTIVPNGCECCRTAVAPGPEDVIYVAYRNLLEGSIRDISLVSSLNDGEDFGEPISFSGDYWEIEGCPHNGPSLSTFGNQIATAWFAEGDYHEGVNFAYLNEKGEMTDYWNLSKAGQFIQNSFLSDGTPIMAYNEAYSKDQKTFSRMMLSVIKENEIYKKEISLPQANAFYPVITGWNEQQMVVAWKGENQIRYTVVNRDYVDEREIETVDEMLSSQL